MALRWSTFPEHVDNNHHQRSAVRGLVQMGGRAAQLQGELEMEMTKRLLNNLLNDESGQDLIEYALIAALIALGAIVAMNSLSTKISNEFNAIGNSL
jgi:pilus assembly protein Flp/PilA